MSMLSRWLDDAGEAARAFLERWSVTLLRLSMGAVFLGFGLLKFLPGMSPAQDLATAAIHVLSFGMLSGDAARLFVATWEVALGILLLTGLLPRLALVLLAFQLIGILSPVVLFTSQLFSGPSGAPTLEGQYVLKDVILVGAALVIAADVLRARRQPQGTGVREAR